MFLLRSWKLHNWQVSNSQIIRVCYYILWLHCFRNDSTSCDAFTNDLLRYLQFYKSDAVHYWCDRLKHADFSNIEDRLVFSVPGYHTGSQMNQVITVFDFLARSFSYEMCYRLDIFHCVGFFLRYLPRQPYLLRHCLSHSQDLVQVLRLTNHLRGCLLCSAVQLDR